MDAPFAPRRRPRTLALELVDALGDRIRDGRLAAGAKLPTEAAIMEEFGISRTVVREAISKLQASGLVATRHGVGTFVVGLGDAAAFRIAPDQFATLRDVIACSSCASASRPRPPRWPRHAARRRTWPTCAARSRPSPPPPRPAATRWARLPVPPGDRARHPERPLRRAARHARLDDHPARPARVGRAAEPRAARYLRRVNGEHESIYDAIAAQDAEAARAAMRTHLANSRERRRRANAQAEGRAAPVSTG
jgi:DNA-binding FadR family transcriptional regulator